MAYAARILQEQLQTFINFEEPKDQSPADEAEDLPFSRNLLRKVDELELSVRSANCLNYTNYGGVLRGGVMGPPGYNSQ